MHLTHTDPEQDWRHQASCKDADANELQPEVASQEQLDATVAKYCHGCPVQTECWNLAAVQGEGAYGIHAGQWYGDKPRHPLAELCAWCEGPMDDAEDTQTNPQRRSTSTYCSTRCRVAAYRARTAAMSA